MSTLPEWSVALDHAPVADLVEADASVIDLRAGSPVVVDDPDASTLGSNGNPPGSGLRRRRRVIVAVLLAVIGVLFADAVIGRVIHDQRQRHLAFDVATSKSDVGVGEAMMVLQIPQIGLNTVVVEGARSSDLRGGPGHVEGSASPNGSGNIVVVGRRTRFEGPFSDLSTLIKGASIAVQTRSGLVRSYVVAEVRTVSDSDRSALAPSDGERLTLVTSGPGLHPDELVVVSATPSDPPVGTPTATEYRPDADALDARPWSPAVGLLLMLFVVGLIATASIVGGRELRARYSRLTVVAVLAPVVGLLVVVLLYSLDAVLPYLY